MNRIQHNVVMFSFMLSLLWPEVKNSCKQLMFIKVSLREKKSPSNDLSVNFSCWCHYCLQFPHHRSATDCIIIATHNTSPTFNTLNWWYSVCCFPTTLTGNFPTRPGTTAWSKHPQPAVPCLTVMLGLNYWLEQCSFFIYVEMTWNFRSHSENVLSFSFSFFLLN